MERGRVERVRVEPLSRRAGRVRAERVRRVDRAVERGRVEREGADRVFERVRAEFEQVVELEEVAGRVPICGKGSGGEVSSTCKAAAAGAKISGMREAAALFFLFEPVPAGVLGQLDVFHPASRTCQAHVWLHLLVARARDAAILVRLAPPRRERGCRIFLTLSALGGYAVRCAVCGVRGDQQRCRSCCRHFAVTNYREGGASISHSQHPIMLNRSWHDCM